MIWVLSKVRGIFYIRSPRESYVRGEKTRPDRGEPRVSLIPEGRANSCTTGPLVGGITNPNKLLEYMNKSTSTGTGCGPGWNPPAGGGRLPYSLLSNLFTVFSHGASTLRLIQHMSTRCRRLCYPIVQQGPRPPCDIRISYLFFSRSPL